ncbi:hypothetical protein IAT38_003506 [Cryptococcus sp. DSM 104549]
MALPLPSLSPAETSYLITSLAHSTSPTRTDARALLQPRPIQISYGVFPNANGSARVIVDGTEVISGVKLEVVDVPEGQAGGAGREEWRAKVEVDVTPQAFPNTPSPAISALSTHLTSLISTHFLHFLPPLPILPNKKYFQPQLHLTLLSASGSLPSTLIIAARAAFADLKVPKTKVITWVGEDDEQGDGRGKGDMSGIKAAIAGARTKGKGRMVAKGSEDWDLDLEDGEGVKEMEGRETLPVLVTLNLVPNSPNIFLDATPQEEVACPTRIHMFFSPSPGNPSQPKVCGIRLEGPDGLDQGRIKGLLERGRSIASELIRELNSSIPK